MVIPQNVKKSQNHCTLMCMHVCQWFYPRLQGLEAGPHWWTLCWEDHSSGMCVSACVCTYCKWFYPRLLGLEACPHWWTLCWEDHSSGMCVSACVCMYVSGFIHSSRVWKLFLTGDPIRGKTTAQVCVSVHVCAHIASDFIYGSKVWKLVLTGGPCGGKTTVQVCVSVHVCAHIASG